MIYSLENDTVKIDIASHGAELQSIYRKDLNINYLWHGDKTYWARRSPILFPIVGRLQNDAFDYDGITYSMSQHGFARDSEFTLVAQTKNSMTLELTYSNDTLKYYPFLFQLRCHYTLVDNTISVQYTIKNLDNKNPLYYSIGAHPAFSTQLNQGDKFDDYTIELLSEESVDEYTLKPPYLVDKAIKTLANPKLHLTYQLFDVDTLIYGTSVKPLCINLYNKQQHGVKINAEHIDFVGIWTPNGKKAPFVCLEPWQGVADTTTHNGDFTQKFGIKKLQANQASEFCYHMSVF